MRVKGKKGLFNLFYIDCQITGTNPTFELSTSLAVDTGCTRTTIMDKDAALLQPELNYRNLPKSSGITGVGGKSRGWYLRGISIKFPRSEPPNHIESLDEILVSKHIARTEARRIAINSVPSTLGLDILKKSKISFENDELILEIPNPNS